MKPRSIAFFACLTAAFLTSCTSRPATSIHVDGAYEAYVPANAVFLAGADIAKIRDTQVFQRVVGATAGNELEKFTAETGIDPRKDLSSFVSWSDGDKTVTLARGKFNEAELSGKLNEHGLKHTSYKGASLYEDGTNSVVFLEPSMAAAGRSQAINSMLDSFEPARRLPLALADRLKMVPANSEVWAVFTGNFRKLRGPASGNLANFMQALDGITGGSLGLDVSDGLDLSARMTCQTNDDARRVHDTARGLIGLGRLSTPDNQPDLLKVFDAIQVNQDQSNVDITARLSQNLADKFLDVWLKRRG